MNGGFEEPTSQTTISSELSSESFFRVFLGGAWASESPSEALSCSSLFLPFPVPDISRKFFWDLVSLAVVVKWKEKLINGFEKTEVNMYNIVVCDRRKIENEREKESEKSKPRNLFGAQTELH